jgi:hypothetical protein
LDGAFAARALKATVDAISRALEWVKAPPNGRPLNLPQRHQRLRGGLAHTTPAADGTLAAFDEPNDLRAGHWRPVRPEETGPRGTTPLFDATERRAALAKAADPNRAENSAQVPSICPE